LVSDVCVTIQSTRIQLSGYGSLYISDLSVLIISDVHLGKSTHFRKNGIPIPIQVMYDDLQNLEILLNHYNPAHLVISGDLFHSDINKEWDIFCRFLSEFPGIRKTLVLGNHDRFTTETYKKVGMDVCYRLILDKFSIIHDAADIDEQSSHCFISGHLHTAVRLKGQAKQQMVLPAFIVSDTRILLPAFGRFTGKAVVKPEPLDKVFVLYDKKISEVRIVI
jgi:DNA ligase-associated metallophosphoesterase